MQSSMPSNCLSASNAAVILLVNLADSLCCQHHTCWRCLRHDSMDQVLAFAGMARCHAQRRVLSYKAVIPASMQDEEDVAQYGMQ